MAENYLFLNSTNNLCTYSFADIGSYANQEQIVIASSTDSLTLNPNSVILSNSSVNFSMIRPTDAQQRDTNYYLNANGLWSKVMGGGGGTLVTGAPINQSFTGDGTTTTFTISGGYSVGFINIFLNGIHLTSNEVAATDESTIVFSTAPKAGISIDVAGFLVSQGGGADPTKPNTWTAEQTFSANIVATTIKADGSLGTAGQVLTSNGSGTYWGSGGGGGGVDPTRPNTWTAEQTFNANIVTTGVKAGGTLGTAGQVLTSNGSGSYWSTPGGGGYVLPIASTTVLGGVKVDNNTIKIDGSGVITAPGGGGYVLPIASTTTLGGVKVDNNTIKIDGSGVITAPGGGGGGSIYFNVKDYGALGNGTKDDSDSIQNAINAAGVAGGTVYFPVGDYLITKTLTITRPDVTLLGDNLRASMIVTASPTITMVSISGIDTARVEKIGLYRNARNVDVSVRGFSVTDSINIVFSYTDSSCSGTGYYVNDTGAQFYNCRFVHDNGSGSKCYGWHLDTSNGLPNPSVYIDNCQAIVLNYPGTSYGIYSQGSNVKDTFIRGYESATVTYGIWIESSVDSDNFDIDISDCIIDTFFGKGIVLTGIAGAAIKGTWLNPAGGGSAVNSVHLIRCRNITVTGNQFFGGPNFAKHIGLQLTNTLSSTISGNAFQNNRYGLIADNVSGMNTISGNSFYNLSFQAAVSQIQIAGYRFSINGNACDGSTTNAIELSSGSNFNIVGMNTTNTNKIQDSGSSNIVVNNI